MKRQYIFIFLIFVFLCIVIPNTAVAEGNIDNVKIKDLSMVNNNEIFVKYKLTGTPPQNYTGTIIPISSGTNTVIGTPICGKLTNKSQTYSQVISTSNSHDSYLVSVNVNGNTAKGSVIKTNESETKINEDTKIGSSEDCRRRHYENFYNDTDNNKNTDNTSKIENDKDKNKPSGNSVFSVLVVFWFLVLVLVIILIK